MRYIERQASEGKVLAKLQENGEYYIYGKHCFFPLNFDTDSLVEIDEPKEEQEDEELI